MARRTYETRAAVPAPLERWARDMVILHGRAEAAVLMHCSTETLDTLGHLVFPFPSNLTDATVERFEVVRAGAPAPGPILDRIEALAAQPEGTTPETVASETGLSLTQAPRVLGRMAKYGRPVYGWSGRWRKQAGQ